MKRIFFSFILMIFASGYSFAGNSGPTQGRWLCNTCSLPPPATAMSGQDLTDALSFIKETVNASVQQWKPNDTIMICDGSSCMLLVYQANGNFLPVGNTVKDSGQGYKNGQVTQKVGVNSDTVTPIGAWYVWFSYLDFSLGYERTRTGTVTIIQPSDSAAAGLGGSFATGFNLGGGNSSFAYGGDTLTGGFDLYQAAFGGGSGNTCIRGICSNPVMH